MDADSHDLGWVHAGHIRHATNVLRRATYLQPPNGREILEDTVRQGGQIVVAHIPLTSGAEATERHLLSPHTWSNLIRMHHRIESTLLRAIREGVESKTCHDRPHHRCP